MVWSIQTSWIKLLRSNLEKIFGIYTEGFHFQRDLHLLVTKQQSSLHDLGLFGFFFEGKVNLLIHETINSWYHPLRTFHLSALLNTRHFSPQVKWREWGGFASSFPVNVRVYAFEDHKGNSIRLLTLVSPLALTSVLPKGHNKSSSSPEKVSSILHLPKFLLSLRFCLIMPYYLASFSILLFLKFHLECYFHKEGWSKQPSLIYYQNENLY